MERPKYADMGNLLSQPEAAKRVTYHPWWKEQAKLKAKDLKSPGKFLIAKHWTFLKDGLDDFRDGLPPPCDGDIVIKGSKGLMPNVLGDSTRVEKKVRKPRYNKHEVCYSRTTPFQQQRRAHLQEVKVGLMQHPLALYPHLEECLPLEVFEDIVDILDPEMNMVEYEDEMDGVEYKNDDDEMSKDEHEIPVEQKRSASLSEDSDTKVRNRYRWLTRKDENDKKDRKKDHRLPASSENAHMRAVTAEFCAWVASLGGENNIEESTITSLFASGYETKPALSVPIHVVELTNVPPELRSSAKIQAPDPLDGLPDTAQTTMKQTGQDSYTPSWAKFSYGKWYLNPKLWKKCPANEPLEDPKQKKEEEKSKAKEKSDKLDVELAPMHAAEAFIDFIDRKQVRRPEFLDHVQEIKEKHELEEKQRQEADLARLRRHRRQTQAAAGIRPRSNIIKLKKSRA